MTRELAIKIIKGDTLGTSEQTDEAVKMAIGALKNEEVQLKSMIEYLHNTGWLQEHIKSVVGQQWIPCSERLPSKEYNFKGFLTTVKCYVENDVFIQVYENGKFGHWDGEKLIPNDDVIAWMPLPEPYKENKNG